MKGKSLPGWRKINFAMHFVGFFQRRALYKAGKNVKKTQANLLREILTYAKDTVYGKEHNYNQILAAKNDDELITLFKKNVPVNDYEDLRPYINRHTHGEDNILFPGKPKMYATTSGTTAEPKWIPITHKYFSDVYGKMNKLWLDNFIRQNPDAFKGGVVTIVGKAIEGNAPDGTVYGSVSGVSFTNCPPFVQKVYSAPPIAFEISDYKVRNYVLFRLGIEFNTTLLLTANPSTFVEMQNNINMNYDDFVNDIEKGIIKKDLEMPEHVRTALEARLRPNPERAAELRKLKAEHGFVLPKHYWPDLAIAATWHCGNTKRYLDKLEGSFPETCGQPEFGYFASECRAGLVMNGKDDTTLFAHMHFFEFTSADDLENENPQFMTLDQLEVGKRYCMYVTTWSGLYRYNMNDLVEVTGFDHGIPTIQFIQKVNGIVTLTGEKLHERQFIMAVHEAEEETGLKIRFHIGFADAERSGYDFYYEFDDRTTTQAQAEEFTKVVDAKLKKINIEYEAKRNSFRVKDPQTFRLIENSFETFKSQCIAEGARDGQFKLLLLLNDEKRHAKFKKLVVED